MRDGMNFCFPKTRPGLGFRTFPLKPRYHGTMATGSALASSDVSMELR